MNASENFEQVIALLKARTIQGRLTLDVETTALVMKWLAVTKDFIQLREKVMNLEEFEKLTQQ